MVIGIAVLAVAERPCAAAPPTSTPRACAEWEPAFGTLIRWPLDIPSSLVVELARDDSLYVLVNNSFVEGIARSAFDSWSIDLDVVRFIHTTTNSEWTRDWGPHSIFDGNGAWGIVDPVFDGYPWVPAGRAGDPQPRSWSDDDLINVDVAAELDAPLFQMPAYATGGNLMVDGYGMGFSTQQMVDENDPLWSESEFRQIMEEYLGLHTYHILGNTEDFGIQHIDCWAKLLDEGTILVKRAPTWHGEYARIEANVAILEGLTNSFGRPYEILRIDCPPYAGGEIAAYTNSLILNRKVLVPLFGIASDTDALATYEEYMPGYEVVGVPYFAWYYYDALHCRTRAIYDRHMLHIAHRPLDAMMAPAPSHIIAAEIDDRSEAGLLTDQLWVHWRESGSSEWTLAPLTSTGGDSFAASIPDHPVGTTIEYYLSAADASGRAETLPRVAPGDYYSFFIGTVTSAPDGSSGTMALRIAGANPFRNSVRFRIESMGTHSTGTEPAGTNPTRTPRLDILDLMGRRVRTLVADHSGSLYWDTRGENGVEVPSGVYWAVLDARNAASPVRNAAQRVILIR